MVNQQVNYAFNFTLGLEPEVQPDNFDYVTANHPLVRCGSVSFSDIEKVEDGEY